MANGLVQIGGIEGQAAAVLAAAPSPQVFEGESLLCGLDVGSTTCKYVLATPWGNVLAQAYERHNTRQAEKILQFLTMLETKHSFAPGRDRVFFTGSGAGIIAPLVGGKVVQEVVAVAAAVDKLHPNVRFVSEIGGEDMKTIFFQGEGATRSKQVLMQSACSGGTGTFIEKTARKLEIAPEMLARMGYSGYPLHKISSKCGIFAEADANTLLKAGVPVEEIIASLFEAVVYQNLATLTRGNTPLPEILLLGGPNLFFKGLQEAWRHHLGKVWKERRVPVADDRDRQDERAEDASDVAQLHQPGPEPVDQFREAHDNGHGDPERDEIGGVALDPDRDFAPAKEDQSERQQEEREEDRQVDLQHDVAGAAGHFAMSPILTLKTFIMPMMKTMQSTRRMNA